MRPCLKTVGPASPVFPVPLCSLCALCPLCPCVLCVPCPPSVSPSFWSLLISVSTISTIHFQNNKCHRFIYGGGGGNDNSFMTKKDCLATCRPDVPVVPAKCMYKATINTKLEDLVKNYIDYIDHVFLETLLMCL